ncbi:hypothetical protein MB901379_03078 [Mycobacterium basiliense]|uniref:Uncharacterized protein n=1 Tax=Mycobacterium basiliense TaxID=2094119 RepID=A0A3S5CZW5_9MYCO|nr:hypothetical protein MB901379_03078 [Mycobacterium basiliense]
MNIPRVQPLRCSSVDGGGKLPTQIHGVLQPQVQARAAHRTVHVRGVTK